MLYFITIIIIAISLWIGNSAVSLFLGISLGLFYKLPKDFLTQKYGSRILQTGIVFLGGSFYSINMLPEVWQKVSLLNPVLYLVSGFKFSFYEISDVSIFTSISTIILIFMILILITLLIFKKGYNLRD